MNSPVSPRRSVVDWVSYDSGLTPPFNRPRPRIFRFKTGRPVAPVEPIDIRRAANDGGQSPSFFCDARASFFTSLSGMGFSGENVTPVLVALSPAAAISSAKAVMALLLM